MDPFVRLRALAAPLPQANVDTDQIIPARFLKRPRSVGYGQFAFYDLRYDAAGVERPSFVLNQPTFRDAKILVAGSNFGCGSSREVAVWALMHDGATDGSGIRAVVAPSFGDIFYGNACKNGVLPVRLPEQVVDEIMRSLQDAPGAELEIDLERQVVIDPAGRSHAFDIAPFHKKTLLEGLDEVGSTLLLASELDAFEAKYYGRYAWIR